MKMGTFIAFIEELKTKSENKNMQIAAIPQYSKKKRDGGREKTRPLPFSSKVTPPSFTHSLVDLELKNYWATFSSGVALQHTLSPHRDGQISAPHALPAASRKVHGMVHRGVVDSYNEEGSERHTPTNMGTFEPLIAGLKTKIRKEKHANSSHSATESEKRDGEGKKLDHYHFQVR